MTYKEFLYRMVTETDLADKEDVTLLIKALCDDLLLSHSENLKYEAKIKEIMSAKDYEEFRKTTAQELFKEAVERIEDKDFKEFCEENMEMIFNDKM